MIVPIQPPNNINRIFVLFGNPGAGKSSGFKNALYLYGLKKENYFHLEPDEIRYYCGTYLDDINMVSHILMPYLQMINMIIKLFKLNRRMVILNYQYLVIWIPELIQYR